MFFQPVYRGNIGMAQRSKQSGFTLKPSQPIQVSGKLLGQRLYRNFPSELGVSRTSHFTHSTFTESGQDRVVA